MLLKDLIKILENNNNSIVRLDNISSTHSHYDLYCNCLNVSISINDLFCIRHVFNIHLVGNNTLWINNISIELDKIETIYIHND